MPKNRPSIRLTIGTTVAAALMATTIAAAGATTTTGPGRRIEAKRAVCIAEIDRRVTALGAVQTRIDAMPRLTAEQKATEDANIASTVTTLNTVNRPAVLAATNRASLAAACSAIYTDVRVFAVVLPQIIDTVKIDRLNSVVASLQALSAKKAAAGADTSSADALISSGNAKLTDAAAATASVTVAGFNADPAGTMATWHSVEVSLNGAFTDLLGAFGLFKAL